MVFIYTYGINNIPEVFLTSKSKKHESRKSPIPYYKVYFCILWMIVLKASDYL